MESICRIRFYKFLFLLVLFSFLGCSNKQDTKANCQNLSIDLYEDFDLFNFEPINLISNEIKFKKAYLYFLKSESEISIHLTYENQAREICLKKNNKNQFYHLIRQEEDYIKEYLYSIFLEDKLITFVLHRKGCSDTNFTLTSLRFLFPIDENKLIQEELIFKLQEELFFYSLEEIDYSEFLFLLNEKYESKYYYLFDYNVQKATKFYVQEDGSLSKENSFKIFSSKSAASPFYYYWQQLP